MVAAAARTVTWFPGHMAKAMAALQRVIRHVDLVLEVRDARVPLSSANPRLAALVASTRHLVVLNKADLVRASAREAALRALRQQGLHAVAATCDSPSGARQVLRAAVAWLQRERAASELSIMMVVGLPNSGKSSLINALKLAAKAAGNLAGEQAYNKRARVGDTPGLTRQVAGFQVCAEPCVYVLDTPGIMVPAVPSDEVGMRLALAGAIKDSVVGEEATVRYLLHLLHTQPQHRTALRNSGPVSPQRSGGSSSSRGSSSSSSRRQQEDGKVAVMRSALWAAATHGLGEGGGPAAAAAAAAAAAGQHAPAGWHPGSDDADAAAGSSVWAAAAAAADDDGDSDSDDGWAPDGDEGDANAAEAWRLEVLLRGLGVAGALNPTQQQGALIRLLQAFRQGQLGKFCLDELPPLPPPT